MENCCRDIIEQIIVSHKAVPNRKPIRGSHFLHQVARPLSSSKGCPAHRQVAAHAATEMAAWSSTEVVDLSATEGMETGKVDSGKDRLSVDSDRGRLWRESASTMMLSWPAVCLTSELN